MKKNFYKLNAAIIGTGRMGQVYYEILKKSKINIQGFFDISKTKLRKFQILNNIDSNKVFRDYKKIFNLKNLDLIIISTTTDLHYFYLKKSIEKNIKYILVEKPLCRSLDEIDEIQKRLKGKKIRLLVNQNQKETFEFKKIQSITKKYNLGKLLSMTVLGGNMGFAMNGVHYLDTFQHITGTLLNEVSANFENAKVYNPRGKKFFDNAGIIVSKNKFNQKIIINISAEQGHARQVSLAYRTGILNFNFISGRLELNLRQKKFIKKPTYLYALPSINKYFKIKLSDVSYSTLQNLEKLISNKNILNDLNISKNNVKVLIASYISNEFLGKKINLNKIKLNKKFLWA